MSPMMKSITGGVESAGKEYVNKKKKKLKNKSSKFTDLIKSFKPKP